jgi:hypothetical protein
VAGARRIGSSELAQRQEVCSRHLTLAQLVMDVLNHDRALHGLYGQPWPSAAGLLAEAA